MIEAEWLTIDELNAIVKIPKSTLYKQLERGDWKHYAKKFGDLWRIHKPSMERF